MLALDADTGQVYRDGELVAQLSVMERDVMRCLVAHGVPLRDSAIAHKVYSSRGSVRRHVENIRKKIGTDAIVTWAYGYGYRAGQQWEVCQRVEAGD